MDIFRSRRWAGVAAAVLAAQVLAVFSLGVTVRDAGAYRSWCRSDPVVVVGDAVADIFVSVPLDGLSRVTGPTQIVVTVPVGVGVTLATPGAGFGYGEAVTFVESPALEATNDGVQVRVAVYVPSSDDAMPIQVEIAARVVGILAPVSAEGKANGWVKLKDRL